MSTEAANPSVGESTTRRSSLLGRHGAVAADGVDAGVAWHYGDPMREQRALAESAGVVDRSNRGVLTVTGEDRLSWLHSITSQHLAHLADGAATEALVLSPHGHVEHHIGVAELAGATYLDVEPGDAEPLAAYLDSMRFWSKVEVTDASDQFAVLTVAGPGVRQVLGAGGIEVPSPGQVAAGDLGLVRRSAWPGSDDADLFVDRRRLAEIIDVLTAAGASPAGLWAFEALRVAARRPRAGFETDHRTIPHELGWIGPAVHLDKGCYRGQETVARVHNLGKPPRRLVLLHLDGSGEKLPAHGDPITAADAGRRVGFVGTAVWHHELGPIALGLVKRTTADEAELLAGGVSAAIDADPAPPA